MNLREDIQRIKEIMGLSEQIKMGDKPNIQNVETPNTNAETPNTNVETPSGSVGFPDSKVKHTVWRVGDIILRPDAGGIWFGETKEDVEKFARSMGGTGEGKEYYINLTNPYYYSSFWGDYSGEVLDSRIAGGKGKRQVMDNLISQGYDGFIIDTDTWNDTGDENSITSKQFVVFNPENVKEVKIRQ